MTENRVVSLKHLSLVKIYNDVILHSKLEAVQQVRKSACWSAPDVSKSALYETHTETRACV